MHYISSFSKERTKNDIFKEREQILKNVPNSR
jgi:predicted O-linked N-acetylglucosamine transferase (SPINDLY family)